MEPEAMKYLAKGLIIFTMLLTPFAASQAVKAAFEAIGRNPKLENSLFSKLIIAIALVETAAIFALVAFFTI
jgi:F0F1-type ATP synthase membrane subunit c/vacuolar-type H+-ATPase subunit K